MSLNVKHAVILCWTLSAFVFSSPAHGANTNPVDEYNVVWESPSKDAGGSMPIGNGDIGLNVWVEKDGDLLFYIGKTDSVSENSDLLKLGRIRVSLSPNPFSQGNFRQELKLRQGEIAIAAGQADHSVSMRIWVDANHAVIHLETESAKPIEFQARVELWRTEPRVIEPKSEEMGGMYELHGSPTPVVVEPDIILPAAENRLCWYHRNERSVYPDVLKIQHLESLLKKYPDPLLTRTFGCIMFGDGLAAADNHTLKTAQAVTKSQLSIAVLTANGDLADWRRQLDALAAAAKTADLDSTRQAHALWWEQFWERSWIRVTGDRKAEQVASGYALQRWVEACAGRGSLPMKFNGGTFTVGRTFSDAADKTKKYTVPDWRAWGSNYWFQNNRHLYWPLIASGDGDLLAPWFKMYVDALSLATDRTRTYYNHGGACFQETIFFFGLPNNANFGWKNKKNETENGFIRLYWSGGIEMTAMMLDQFDYTQDQEFARTVLVPFADAITTFYDQHWKRDANGKIHFEPAQSLETWHFAINPLPEIAGLKYVLPRLLALPEMLTTGPQRTMWAKTLADLPPVPVGPGTDGKPVLLPAEVFRGKANSENTELYAIYPYRLFGIGHPDLELARHSYQMRRSKGSTCWSQDPMDAALLGLPEDAKAAVSANFANTGARFQSFWKPGHDWIPDLDNGGAGMQALQWMLMQCDGRRIQLIPAWPKDWNADFKLHAPFQTIVEASVRGGQVVDLKVTPEERKKDVVIAGAAE